MTPRTIYIVHLRPLPKVDGTRALRGMLKMALRRHGLRCVSISTTQARKRPRR